MAIEIQESGWYNVIKVYVDDDRTTLRNIYIPAYIDIERNMGTPDNYLNHKGFFSLREASVYSWACTKFYSTIWGVPNGYTGFYNTNDDERLWWGIDTTVRRSRTTALKLTPVDANNEPVDGYILIWYDASNRIWKVEFYQGTRRVENLTIGDANRCSFSLPVIHEPDGGLSRGYILNSVITRTHPLEEDTYDGDVRYRTWEITSHGGVYQAFFDDLNINIEVGEISTDPYAQAGASESGGGKGSYDATSDNVGIPELPQIGTDVFTNMYQLTPLQAKALGQYLWSDDFDLDNLKKMFQDPMDAIISMHVVPVNASSGLTSNIVVGNISTSVQGYVVSNQFVEVDCGTIKIYEYFGSYLDYAPYTQIQLYLPFIGVVNVNTDEVVGRNTHIVYHVDVLSGACVAYISVGNELLYTFTGNCSIEMPINSNNWSNVISSVINLGVSSISNYITGNALGEVGAIAGAVQSMKPQIERSGSMSSTAGMLGQLKPYFIITRPKVCIPENQNSIIGYPSYITTKLDKISGFNRIDDMRFNNFSGLEGERLEIISLLKEGVIL